MPDDQKQDDQKELDLLRHRVMALEEHFMFLDQTVADLAEDIRQQERVTSKLTERVEQLLRRLADVADDDTPSDEQS